MRPASRRALLATQIGRPGRLLLLAGCILAATTLRAIAQGRGPGGPPSGGGNAGMPNGNPNYGPNYGGPGAQGNLSNENRGGMQNNQAGTAGGGLRLGPPGRWWNDKRIVKDLHLRPDQQARMDAIFQQDKAALIARYQALKQEESTMERLSRGKTLDEPTLFAQIDRVTQARGELEKTIAHSLIRLRREMDADQVTRLEAYE